MRNTQETNLLNSQTLLNQSVRNDTVATNINKVSTFDKSFQQATTFNAGKLVPIFLQECYPGDVYDVDISSLIRLSAIKSTPFMNCKIDLNFFFVPYNQIDPNFSEVMGENKDYGFSNSFLNFPLLHTNISSEFNYNENDLGNYFNIPINLKFGEFDFNLYPFLAYGKVWNDWYRDQNLQGSIDITSCFNKERTISSCDWDKISSNNSVNVSFYQSIIYGKGLAPSCLLPSYFSSCLPYQQKGEVINVGGQINFKGLKISGSTSVLPNYGDYYTPIFAQKMGGSFTDAKNSLSGGIYKQKLFNSNTSDDPSVNAPADSQYLYMKSGIVDSSSFKIGLNDGYNENSLINVSINDLRNSLIYQHLTENFALCGSRYIEQLKSIWGIEIDPKTINRTELITSFEDVLQFSNVVQTSSTTATSPLGSLSSNLFNSVNVPHFSYASSQHGLILGLITVRTLLNNGGQGMPKIFKYNNFLDFYNPMFQGISEQPIFKNELIATTYNTSFDFDYDLFSGPFSIFGYNEPFLNTKYNIDNANGFLSLNSKTSLFPYFLYGIKYNENVRLNSSFIEYDPNIIGNTLFKVNENSYEFYHQFLAIFTFNIRYTTQQKLFNRPGVSYI